MNPLFRRYRKLHLVGVGGAGMAGLAHVLMDLGCLVSGSDSQRGPAMASLEKAGCRVFHGHAAEQVGAADLVVFSAAVPLQNVELKAARQRGIPLVGRAEMIGQLTRPYYTLGIAGSHGKTTSAAMLTAILKNAGYAPSHLVGGWVGGQVQAKADAGDFFVVEADEFARSFLHLLPSAALVTNIDAEHLDCYGDWRGVQEAFVQFLGRLPFYGECLLNGDDPGITHILTRLKRDCRTFGLSSANDYRAEAIGVDRGVNAFEIVTPGKQTSRIELQVPGRHNVLNALGAAALALELGTPMEAVQMGLTAFGGIDRRFTSKGVARGVEVVDDYAHHPAEVQAAIATAQDTQRRVVAVFQPHLYSRTQALSAEFAAALQAADQVFVTEVYASREEPLPGVDAEQIVQQMRDAGYATAEYIAPKELLVGRLLETCTTGDLVLTMGAGDIDQVADELVAALASRSEGSVEGV